MSALAAAVDTARALHTYMSFNGTRPVRSENYRAALIRQSLETHYYTGWRSPDKYADAAYQRDLYAHLYGRLQCDRRRVAPWLDRARDLRGSKILEIGCGTGSSTVALSERGAQVTAIDIDEGALAVAKKRCDLHGLNAHFRALNAADLGTACEGDRFDFIIFFACLEHMLLQERLDAIRAAWDLLPVGALFVVVETPNRLWFFDEHTSQLPFFSWLPDDLAFEYSRFSPRQNFRELYGEFRDGSEEHFLRRGRGVSFHEFEVAIGPVQQFKVVSSLSSAEGLRYTLRQSKLERRYKSLLRQIYPGIHQGFLDSYLYLIIEKTHARRRPDRGGAVRFKKHS